MWNEKDVLKIRGYYKAGNPDPSAKLSEYMKEIDRMDEYQHTDKYFREYIFDLGLNNKDTAQLLNYAGVDMVGVIPTLMTVLFFVLFLYNIIFNFYISLISLGSRMVDPKLIKRTDINDRISFQMFTAIFSSSIYYFIYIVWNRHR